MWDLVELKNLETLSEADTVLSDVLSKPEIQVIQKMSKNGMAVENLKNRVIIPLSWKNNKIVRVFLSTFYLISRNIVLHFNDLWTTSSIFMTRIAK